MSDIHQQRVEAIAKALHQYHGRGYCTLGVHQAEGSFKCQEEATVVLLALDGLGPVEYPQPSRVPTLAARREARERKTAVNKNAQKAAKAKAQKL